MLEAEHMAMLQLACLQRHIRGDFDEHQTNARHRPDSYVLGRLWFRRFMRKPLEKS